MRRKLATATLAAALLSAVAPASGLATSTGIPGQPNQDCESLGVSPAGFGTGGFANAKSMYAGAGSGSTTHNANGNAVSQYDVACFQLKSH